MKFIREAKPVWVPQVVALFAIVGLYAIKGHDVAQLYSPIICMSGFGVTWLYVLIEKMKHRRSVDRELRSMLDVP